MTLRFPLRHCAALRRRLRPAALAALLLALAACGSLTGPREDFTIYTLSPAVAPAEGPRLDWQLVVEAPQASELLAGARIVVAPDARQRQVYAGARWSARTPELVQDAWLRAFERDGRLPGVARAGSGVRADLILAADLVAFEARYRDGAPVVEVALQVRLVDPRRRRIVAQRGLRSEHAPDGSDIGPVVAAFERALGEVTQDLVAWVVQEGPTALQAQPATHRD